MKDAPQMPVGDEVFWIGLLLVVLGGVGSVYAPAPVAGLYGIIIGVCTCLFWWVNACEFKKKIQDEQAEAEAQLLSSAESNTALEKASNFATGEAAHNSEEVAAIRWTETGEQRVIKPTAKPVGIGNLELEILEP